MLHALVSAKCKVLLDYLWILRRMGLRGLDTTAQERFDMTVIVTDKPHSGIE
jgi:hypothetical protein